MSRPPSRTNTKAAKGETGGSKEALAESKNLVESGLGTIAEPLAPLRDLSPQRSQLDRARLRALEELMIDVLRLDQLALPRLLEEANEPIRYTGEGVSAELEYQETVRAAKRRLLTRAMHPGGLLSEDEVEDGV